MYGYIYENNFTLFNLNINKIKTDVDRNCNYQFIKSMHCQKNTSFLLIVTTHNPHEVGEFSITVSGPTDVNIKNRSMSLVLLVIVIDVFELLFRKSD